jgi:hypothetical protein
VLEVTNKTQQTAEYLKVTSFFEFNRVYPSKEYKTTIVQSPSTTRAYLFDNAIHLLYSSGAGVHVRGPQSRAEQMLAAEDIEGKIAIIVVVAVKESAGLIAVDNIVGGVRIENNRSLRVSPTVTYGLEAALERKHQKAPCRQPFIDRYRTEETRVELKRLYPQIQLL